MPNRTDKILFIAGLLSYLTAQIWLNLTGSLTIYQVPIDYAHWLMLIGVTLLIPFTTRLPREGAALFAAPILLIGIILTVGACILDFVLWSLPDQPLRGQVFDHLVSVPLLWALFIQISGFVFTPGIAFVSLVYWKHTKIGPVLTFAGAIMIGAWPFWSNSFGYAMILAGFLICFRADHQERSNS